VGWTRICIVLGKKLFFVGRCPVLITNSLSVKHGLGSQLDRLALVTVFLGTELYCLALVTVFLGTELYCLAVVIERAKQHDLGSILDCDSVVE
jgi:hypothetical protein